MSGISSFLQAIYLEISCRFLRIYTVDFQHNLTAHQILLILTLLHHMQQAQANAPFLFSWYMAKSLEQQSSASPHSLAKLLTVLMDEIVSSATLFASARVVCTSLVKFLKLNEKKTLHQCIPLNTVLTQRQSYFTLQNSP